MHRLTILSLKGLIVAIVALLVILQIFVIPGVALQSAEQFVTLSFLRIPGIIVAELFLLCVQIVLICVWRLLTMVRAAAIFSNSAFTWVNIILGAIVSATALIALALLILVLADVVHPSVLLLCALGIVVGSGLALLIVVMRGLLRNARQLQEDLAEVV